MKVFTPIFILLSFTLSAQSPQWHWAVALEEVSPDTATSGGASICTDPATGSVFTIGTFHGTIDANPGAPVYPLTASGAFDMVISRLDSTGQFIWAGRIGGPGEAFVIARQVCHDPGGFIYIVGEFSGTVDFNPGANTYNLTADGYYNAYLLKLDAAGNFIWVNTWGNESSFPTCVSVVINYATDQVYCTGTFSGQMDFDPGKDEAILYPGDLDTYFSCFEGGGNFLWVKQMTGFGEVQSNQLAIDQQNQQLFVTGHYYNFIDFDPGAGVYIMDSYGDPDIFIQCLSANGDLVWVHGMGANGVNASGVSISFNSAGNGSVYVSGWITGQVDMDPGPGMTNILSGTYITRFSLTGEFIWAISALASAIDTDKTNAGNVYAVSGYYNNVDADPGPGIFILNNLGEADIAVIKFDSSGIFQWAKTAGGPGNDIGKQIFVTQFGQSIITGNFESDTLPFDATVLTNDNSENLFIAKLNSSGCTAIVTNTNDAGPGSLRDVIGCVASGMAIDFNLPSNSQIVLTSGEIIINKNITLHGSGMFDITLSGNNISRIFHLLPGKTLSIENMALKHASYPHNGGAIWSEGDLELQNVLFENNLDNGLPKSMSLQPGSELTLWDSNILRL